MANVLQDLQSAFGKVVSGASTAIGAKFNKETGVNAQKLVDAYNDYLIQMNKDGRDIKDTDSFSQYLKNNQALVDEKIPDKTKQADAIKGATDWVGDVQFGSKKLRDLTNGAKYIAEEAKEGAASHLGLFAGLIPAAIGLVSSLASGDGFSLGSIFNIGTIAMGAVVGLAADYFMNKDTSIVTSIIDMVTGKKKDGPQQTPDEIAKAKSAHDEGIKQKIGTAVRPEDIAKTTAVKQFTNIEIKPIPADDAAKSDPKLAGADSMFEIPTTLGAAARVYGTKTGNKFEAIATRNIPAPIPQDPTDETPPAKPVVGRIAAITGSFSTEAHTGTDGKVTSQLTSEDSGTARVLINANRGQGKAMAEADLLLGNLNNVTITSTQPAGSKDAVIHVESKAHAGAAREFLGHMDDDGKIGIHAINEKTPDGKTVPLELQTPVLIANVGVASDPAKPKILDKFDQRKLLAGENFVKFKDLAKLAAPDTDEKDITKKLVTPPINHTKINTLNMSAKPAQASKGAPLGGR